MVPYFYLIQLHWVGCHPWSTMPPWYALPVLHVGFSSICWHLFWSNWGQKFHSIYPESITLHPARLAPQPRISIASTGLKYQNLMEYDCMRDSSKRWKNKATGWLGALVRVTNLKFWFLRLRDKMLVFAGVVKKCLQHGHSFRLAGVWLKSENVRFACAVTRFCSSRVKKNIRNLWFSIIRIISGRHSLFQFFPLLDASGARALVATQKPQSATRQRCDAMSSCRPKCTFFCTV